jgi:hypothetical protein
MKTETSTDPVEVLLSASPYGLAAAEKRALLLDAVQQGYRHHYHACEAYRRFCQRRGCGADQVFGDVSEFPYLPVQAFKENASLLRSVESSQITTRLSSSATSGVASSVDIDRVTAKRQVRALASVIGAVLGPKRRPFLVLDADPRTAGPGGLGARGAAVRGFLNLAREARYFMEAGPQGLLTLKEREFAAQLEAYASGSEPVAVFGFTFVLYVYAVLPLLKEGRKFRLPKGSQIIHIGGWKKLADQQVSKAQFNETMEEVFGVSASNVVDFYGFTEQMGVTYPDGPGGSKYAPAFAEVIVRDPSTFKPLPDGREGLLEFVTPIPYSYPGIAVLTDDVGVITQRDAEMDGWRGTRFQILGRAKKAEVRGCGDIMGEKVAGPTTRASHPTTKGTNTGVRLLFGPETNAMSGDLFAPVVLESLPEVADLGALAARLREGARKLQAHSVDDLIALVSAAAARWADPNSPLAPLRQQGLLFLTGWCQASNLRAMANGALHGQRGFLDGFRALGGTNRRLMRAQPRGLVAHWLAGNVPLLGMLALAQAIITRNANLLKAASTFSRVLPGLLEAFRGLTVTCVDGRVLHGEDVLASIAVVYYSRDNVVAGEQLAALADVRLAWGGREAIESILNLPKRYGTEDVIFGPKLSYMVVGREAIAETRLLRRVARQAATDASVFDQYACASPHTIFVEKGGKISPREFAEALSAEMSKAIIRIPKGPTDAGTAAKIESLRMRYEFTGELWRSKGTEWTVLYDEDAGQGLASPCYSRVITVRAIDDVMEASRFAHGGIQTIGMALSGERKLQFASEASARGAERFPDIGRMTFFDSPWDGLFPMERFVKWITVGGPF